MTFPKTIAVLSALACSASWAYAGKLKESDVPKPVLEAFAARYPKAVVKAYSKEKKMRGGQACYELESRDGDVDRDVIIAADGKVLEVEEGIPLESLPEAVVAAVKAEHPGAVLRRAERLTRGEETLYEVTTLQGKKRREVLLDPQGGKPGAKRP